MAKNSRRLKIGNILVTLVVLTISGYFLYQAGSDIVSTLKLTSQVKDSQKQIELLEEENKMLINQKNKLQDPEYIKSYARGAYMLSKNGEQIFHIRGDE